MRIGIAIDSSHALFRSPSRLDRSAPFNLSQHCEEQRLVDLVQRHPSEIREDVAFQAGDHIVRVNLLPARQLKSVPLSCSIFKG